MKYFSKKVKNEHGVFDSNAEYGRFLYLKYLEDNGEISDLQRQVRFEIIPKLVKEVEVKLKTKTKIVEKVEEQAANYTADFTYMDSCGKYIVEECKGSYLKNLADYVLRKKLIKQLIHKHNLEKGFEDWVFYEYIPSTTRKRKEKNATNKTTKVTKTTKTTKRKG